PARVTEDVDVARPEGQPLVHAAVALAQVLVVLGARLVGDRLADPAQAVHVERRRQRDRLREDRGDAGARDAVQALVPPVVGGDAEAGDGGRLVHHLPRLLFQRQTRQEVVEARLEGEVGILKGKGGRHGDSITVATEAAGIKNELVASSGPRAAKRSAVPDDRLMLEVAPVKAPGSMVTWSSPPMLISTSVSFVPSGERNAEVTMELSLEVAPTRVQPVAIPFAKCWTA